MPRYFTPSGKSIFVEEEVPEDELEGLFNEIDPIDSGPVQEEIAGPESGAGIEEIPAPQPVVQPPLRRAWDAINTPMLEMGDAEEYHPGLNTSPLAAKVGGFFSGIKQGALDTIESMSSPLNAASLLLGGGAAGAARAGLTGVARGLSIAAKVPEALTAAHGASEVFGQDKSLGERAIGAAELLGGVAGVKSKIPAKGVPNKPAPVAIANDALKNAETVLQRNGYSAQTLGLTPEEAIEFAEKLTGQSAPLPTPTSSVSMPRPTTLSSELSGAKPRFNIGPKSYEPQFDNDIDKALFIISQGKPSKRDADYLKFVMDATGLDEGKARQAGQQLRNSMKGHLAGQEVGPVKLPKLFTPPEAPKPGKPKIKMIGNQPDMNDPVTAEWVNKANSKQPVPQAERIPPSKEIDIPEEVETLAPDGTPLGNGVMGKVLKEEPSALQNFFGLPRALQSTYDLSFPFRQGLGLIHTKGWWTSWGKMLKSFGSEASYQGLMDSISERPNFKPRTILKNGVPTPGKSLAEEAGLAITDLKGMREEELSSSWAEKLPGVRASSRAYSAFANKLRADTFDDLVEKAKNMGTDPNTNLALAKEIANFVNNASGRGDLGKLSAAADAMNNVMFSPRLMASRVQMMNPVNYVFGNKMVRKEYLKSMMYTAGAWATMAGMAKMAGADVNMDPTNSDFGKIKIGDTRLDPAGGFQQYVVLATRLAKGEFTSSTSGKTTRYGEKYGDPTRMDALVDFIQNKLAPVPSYGARMLNANSKMPFYVGDETARLFTPILVQDIYELMNENPDALGIAVPANMVGIGSNTYGKGPQVRMFPESWETQIPAKRRR